MEEIMIKGINKNIVVIKNTGSRYFEEAHFILRNGVSDKGAEDKFLNEAHRIVSSVLIEQGKQSKNRKAALFVLIPILSFAVGIAVGLLSALLL